MKSKTVTDMNGYGVSITRVKTRIELDSDPMVSLTPAQARALGRALIQMADEIRPERKRDN